MKAIGLSIRKEIRTLGVKQMNRTLSKFSLPFDEATTSVHFPKTLKHPQNNAGPAGIELLIMTGIGLLIRKGIGLLIMKGIGLLIMKGIELLIMKGIGLLIMKGIELLIMKGIG